MIQRRDIMERQKDKVKWKGPAKLSRRENNNRDYKNAKLKRSVQRFLLKLMWQAISEAGTILLYSPRGRLRGQCQST